MKGYLLLAVSLGLLLHAAPANAAFVSAELRVNGLGCPFCAFGIEKKLLDVDGVTGVEVVDREKKLHFRQCPISGIPSSSGEDLRTGEAGLLISSI